jgi:hypothetical protein
VGRPKPSHLCEQCNTATGGRSAGYARQLFLDGDRGNDEISSGALIESRLGGLIHWRSTPTIIQAEKDFLYSFRKSQELRARTPVSPGRRTLPAFLVNSIASSLLCVEMFCLGIMAGTGLHWLLGCRAWLSGLLEDAPPPMQATGDYIFGVGACFAREGTG